MKLTKLAPIAPSREGNKFNPFFPDCLEQGQSCSQKFDNTLVHLFGNEDKAGLSHIIVINTLTGERWRLDIEEKQVCPRCGKSQQHWKEGQGELCGPCACLAAVDMGETKKGFRRI